VNVQKDGHVENIMPLVTHRIGGKGTKAVTEHQHQKYGIRQQHPIPQESGG